MNDNKKYWFVFCKTDLLLEQQPDGSWSVPYQETPPVAMKPWTTIHHVTTLSGEVVETYSVDLPPTEDETHRMCGLRASYNDLQEELYIAAGKCAEILYWDSTTKFCGVCGGPMRLHTDISKRCTCCGKEVWPQLATAVICLVSRGDEVLLVHARNSKRDFSGLVAGFVETGETLEEAVEREVMEETGIRIRNIHYFASQPWPYPCGLMVGFFADYESGDIHLQRSELSKGGWYRYDALPPIPEKLSIARRLIDHWTDMKNHHEP